MPDKDPSGSQSLMTDAALMTDGALGARVPQAPVGRFTRWQRIGLVFVSWAGYWAIRLIGPTLRFHTSFEEGAGEDDAAREIASPGPKIYVFWHRCIFPAAWHWRGQNVQVISSNSFDGEYTARIVRRFGFGTVRGSSSRGAVRAFLGMQKQLQRGRTVAFTVDGPRGPIYVAKPGPVMLGRNTGRPILGLHIMPEKRWELGSWDRLMIPWPFSHVHIRIARPVRVPPDIDEAGQDLYHAKMQAALDRARVEAERQAGV